MHPGPGNRQAVAHGLFGALIVEPPGSTYRNPTTGLPQLSGWEADIIPAARQGRSARTSRSSTRSATRARTRACPLDIDGLALPDHRPAHRRLPARLAGDQLPLRAVHGPARLRARTRSPSSTAPTPSPTRRTSSRAATSATRPSSASCTPAARSSTSTTSTAAPIAGASTRRPTRPTTTARPASTSTRSRSSRSRPASTRSRWAPASRSTSRSRTAPAAPSRVRASSCSTATSPTTTSRACGATGASSTRSSPTSCRCPTGPPLPQAVDSAGAARRGRIAGQTITAQNLDAWIRPQLPTQGVTTSHQREPPRRHGRPGRLGVGLDGRRSDRALPRRARPGHHHRAGRRNRALARLRQRRARPSGRADRRPGRPEHVPAQRQPGHLQRRRVHRQPRPRLLFNPTNGRPAWPLLRPHIGKRPPFSPNGHSGAPYLGEYGEPGSRPRPPGRYDEHQGHRPVGEPRTMASVPRARRCAPTTSWASPCRSRSRTPARATWSTRSARSTCSPRTRTRSTPARRSTPVSSHASRWRSAATSATASRSPTRASSPTAARRCRTPRPTSTSTTCSSTRRRSDGVISGFSFEQSIRPYKIVDPQLTADAPTGDTVLTLVERRQVPAGRLDRRRPGHREHRDPPDRLGRRRHRSQVTLSKALANAHPAGEWAGTEFVQYRWYPDVELDNIFFHDHVNGIHGWSHGMVGQLHHRARGLDLPRPRDGRGDPGRRGRRHPHRPDCVPRTDRRACHPAHRTSAP